MLAFGTGRPGDQAGMHPVFAQPRAVALQQERLSDGQRCPRHIARAEQADLAALYSKNFAHCMHLAPHAGMMRRTPRAVPCFI